jgi:hypothetical protein
MADGKGKEFMSRYFTGWAFVSFNSSSDQLRFLQRYYDDGTSLGSLCCDKRESIIY